MCVEWPLRATLPFAGQLCQRALETPEQRTKRKTASRVHGTVTSHLTYLLRALIVRGRASSNTGHKAS